MPLLHYQLGSITSSRPSKRAGSILENKEHARRQAPGAWGLWELVSVPRAGDTASLTVQAPGSSDTASEELRSRPGAGCVCSVSSGGVCTKKKKEGPEVKMLWGLPDRFTEETSIHSFSQGFLDSVHEFKYQQVWLGALGWME